MLISDMLQRVAAEFSYERGRPFKGSEFGDFVRSDLAKAAKNQLVFWPFELKVKASVGAGNWAAVPWLAFFDPLVTETATKGFYVVYLINAQDRTITLSMNQGTTAIYNEFGRRKGRDVLRRRAVDIADRVSDFADKFSISPIDLGSSEDLPAGYEAGHAFGVTYQFGELNEDRCLADLKMMLEAYSTLVERGGLTPTDVMMTDENSSDIEETRRLVLSKRIERSPKVRREVLSQAEPKCEGCGLRPIQDYQYTGKPEQIPLDVHHARPLFELAEGESKRYRVPDDFLVLCPTCHRMIHKQSNPADLQALRARIRFKHMREV